MSRILAALACAALALPAAANAVAIGKPAPDFIVFDSNGATQKLSAYRGKIVVLEWNNPGCPFVQKHYGSGNMQKTQAAAKAAGAVWLTVNSGGPGKQGFMNRQQANAFLAQEKAVPTAYLLDPKGVLGRGYEAKTTPGMYVIDARGTLVYKGAIDDKATADPADIAGAKNLVLAAVTETAAGKPVTVAETRGYGCSVKYAD
jgi:peroxiredoxin